MQFPRGATGEGWSKIMLEAFPYQGATPCGDCAAAATAGSYGSDIPAESEGQNWGVTNITSVVMAAVHCSQMWSLGDAEESFREPFTEGPRFIATLILPVPVPLGKLLSPQPSASSRLPRVLHILLTPLSPTKTFWGRYYYSPLQR